jgi:hypothetical protein
MRVCFRSFSYTATDGKVATYTAGTGFLAPGAEVLKFCARDFKASAAPYGEHRLMALIHREAPGAAVSLSATFHGLGRPATPSGRLTSNFG